MMVSNPNPVTSQASHLWVKVGLQQNLALLHFIAQFCILASLGQSHRSSYPPIQSFHLSSSWYLDPVSSAHWGGATLMIDHQTCCKHEPASRDWFSPQALWLCRWFSSEPPHWLCAATTWCTEWGAENISITWRCLVRVDQVSVPQSRVGTTVLSFSCRWAILCN